MEVSCYHIGYIYISRGAAAPMVIMSILFPLLYLAVIVFGFYTVITILKSLKERNVILSEIRDELRKNNGKL